MECATLLARQPDPSVLHQLAQRLTGYLQAVIFRQRLSSKGWPKIDVVLFDQRHSKLTHRRINTVVRSSATRFVTDRGGTIGLKILQQSMHLSSAQSQNICRRHSRHCASCHLAQYFNPVQLALAHDHPFHGQSPVAQFEQESDILELHRGDIIALRLHSCVNTYNDDYVVLFFL